MDLVRKYGLVAVLMGVFSLTLTNAINVVSEHRDIAKVDKLIKSTVIICDKDGRTIGTGFFVNGRGKVITAAHVTNAVQKTGGGLGIRLAGGGECLDAYVVKSDRSIDVAIIKAPAVYSLDYLEVINSESVRRGDEVWVVGHPYGLTWNVTRGIVSKKSFVNMNGRNKYVIWTTAWIEQGNSGSALVNSKGQVIGIITEFVNPKFEMATHLNVATPGTEIVRFMGDL